MMDERKKVTNEQEFLTWQKLGYTKFTWTLKDGKEIYFELVPSAMIEVNLSFHRAMWEDLLKISQKTGGTVEAIIERMILTNGKKFLESQNTGSNKP